MSGRILRGAVDQRTRGRRGALTGANVTPELRAKLSGVNRTNTVVESVFALEKYLSTREKGSNLVYRRGWTLFKYNKTWAWGELLDGKRLKLYGEVSRKEAARLRKEEGSQREQLARLFKAKAAEREAKLAKLRARAAARADGDGGAGAGADTGTGANTGAGRAAELPI